MNKKYTLILKEFMFPIELKEDFDMLQVKILNEHFQGFKIKVQATNALKAHEVARKEFEEIFLTEYKQAIQNIEKYNFILHITEIEVE